MPTVIFDQAFTAQPQLTRYLKTAMPSHLRRQWSYSDKMKVVQETLVEGGSIQAVAKKYSLHKNQVSLWRQFAIAGKLDESELDKKRANASKSLSNLEKIMDGYPSKGRRSWSELEKCRIVSESYDNKSSVTIVSRGMESILITSTTGAGLL